MNEEELQLLITLDDPEDGAEEDTFHLQAKNALEHWLGQRCQFDQRAVAASDNDDLKVTFGQGDWTCTLSKLSGTTPNKKFDLEFCTVTRREKGEIVEQKVFYDLIGMQKQI